jgi:hypothetical protein
MAMQGTPSQPVPGRAGVKIPIRVRADVYEFEAEEGEPVRKEQGPRKMYIKKRHFEKYGYTENCEGCRRLRAGGAMGLRPHTKQCRKRIEEEMARDEEGKEWIEKARMRDEAYTEEIVREMEKLGGEKKQDEEKEQEDTQAKVKAQREKQTEKENREQRKLGKNRRERKEQERRRKKQKKEQGKH